MKNKEILLSKLLFFLAIGAFGGFVNFINLHLEQVVGLTGSQIGLITFIGLIVTVIMNPVWGYLSDKTGKHTLLLKFGFFTSALMGALYFSSRSFALVILSVVLFDGIRAPLMPILEYITTNHCEKYKYSFGKIRVFGAVSFMLVTMATGVMVAGMDVQFLGIHLAFDGFMGVDVAAFGGFILFNLLAFAAIFFMPAPEKKAPTDRKIKTFNQDDIKALLFNKKFLFILIFSMLTLIAQEAAFSYSGMHLVTTLGAEENIISLVSFFMVMPEIIILPIGTVLILKFGFKNWYIISLIGMMMRLGIYSFTHSPLIFALGGVFHGLMIIMHALGTISYIRKVVAPQTMGLAFTLMASSMALSRALMSLLFGFIYENIDSFTVFRVALGFVSIGLVLAIRSQYLKEVGEEVLNSWR